MVSGTTFHARALAEAKRYGQDDLVFLRELAQNARDARASRIQVVTGADDDQEWLTFDDDGVGMTFAHARAFLFRLYASSKEGDLDAAGCFGVGFWSVLRWEPTAITVESRRGQESWAVTLDAGLRNVVEATCIKRAQGTRITLRRPRQAASAAEHAQRIEQGLRRYCRYLRRHGRRPVPLPISCDGIRINERFSLPGPVSLAFANAHAEGVVGLGEEPRVELYARGLLVMTATVLEELEPGREVPPRSRTLGGLAPVVLLNSNRLELVLSRQAPKANRELARLVRLAQARVQRLAGHVVDRACPRPLAERLWDWVRLRPAAVSLWHVALSAVVCCAVVVGAIVLGSQRRDSRGTAGGAGADAGEKVLHVRVEGGPTAADSLSLLAAGRAGMWATTLPYSNLQHYQGATVEVPDASVMPWGLSYEGPAEVSFRAATLDRYDPQHGFLHGTADELEPHPPHLCRAACVRVRLSVLASPEPLVIPVPTGHRLVPRTLRFGTAPLEKVYLNAYDEAVVSLPEGASGVLEYTTGPHRDGRRPAVEVAEVDLPLWLERELAAAARLPTRRKVERITRLVRTRITYDVTPATVHAFATEAGDWLHRVLAVGAGDCDVKNGLNVLLLRRLGIPARLAVGIAGHGGRARPHLHAWTEYYLDGWRAIDATGAAPTPAVTATPAPPRVALPLAPSAGRPPVVAPRATGPAASSPATTPRAKGRAPAAAPPLAVPGSAPRAPAVPPLGGAPISRALFAGAVVVALWLWWRRRVRERVLAPGDAREQRVALARLVREALTHPGGPWRQSGGLWRRRILPTLAGAPMSLAEAIERSVEGTLFVSRERSELARLAAAAGTRVLDAGDPTFAEAVATLGHGVDLDALERLKPPTAENAGAGNDAVAAAVDRLNDFLARAGQTVRCHLVPALNEAPLRDVDLSAVRLPPRARWPKRFVAFNPAAAELLARAELSRVEPARAIFVLVDWLVDASQLLARDAARLREKAACELVEAWR